MTAPADASDLEPVPSDVGVTPPVPVHDIPPAYAPLSAGEVENLRGQHAGFASRFFAFICGPHAFRSAFLCVNLRLAFIL